MASSVPQLRAVHTLVACSPRPGRVDLFVAGDNGEVWQKTFDGVSQQVWRSHGRPWPIESLSRFDRLAVTIPALGRIQLFAHRADTHELCRIQSENDQWTGWAPEDPGEQAGWPWVTAPPGHVFVVGRDGTLSHWEPDRGRHHNLGGYIIGGDSHVAATSAPGGVDVFAIWHGAAIMRRSWVGVWSQWELLDVLRVPTGAYTALRPRDLVSLSVTGSGVREQVGTDGNREWVAEGPQGRLIVNFPPQHIAETVLPSGGSSSRARLAGSSRLHFNITNQRVQLSVEGMLAAMTQLPLVVGPPHGQGSTLELPWQLLLALEPPARCSHRRKPASTADGRTELWHTRILGSGTNYAAVRPFRSFSREPSFADQTPLADRVVAAIAAEGTNHPPMAVDRLILSACGAWFSGSVTYPQVDWTHRSAMARDYYVKVVTRGVAFPFGHRAAVVKITERRFDSGVAGLHATFSLIITEPSRNYGVSAPHERAFLFQRIEIEPLISPVDDPGASNMFWPTRNGEPLIFSVRGWAASEVIDMRLPLLFSDGSTQPEDLDREYARGPRGADDLVDAMAQRPTAFVGRFMPLAMKNQQEALEDATQQVQSLTFGGAQIPGTANFHPKVTQLSVALPAVRQLLGQVEDIPATLSSELLHATSSRPPDVLLEFASLALNFASANAGVVAAPNMSVNRISRSVGPKIDRLPTDPAALFGAASAKLLGIIPLSAVIPRITGAPTITWSQRPNPVAKMHWKENLAKQLGPFKPGATCTVDLTVQSSFPDGGGPPNVITDGTLNDFDLIIPKADDPENSLVVLKFSQLKFRAETGKLPTTAFTIASAELGGNLSFIKTLSKYLPTVGNSGPKVDMTATEIRVAYAVAIPTPLGMGVFTLQNLQLKAGVTLSLVNQPIAIDFSFGTRMSPFLVTVSGFGGGGYLELGIGAGGENGGLQRFVGGIEFGAAVAMNFGIAFGEVHVFGGVVFTKQQAVIEIAGYLRIGGMVRVLGLISVSVELTISLTYIGRPSNELRGEAKLVITIDLTFWSTSVELRCEKRFEGPDLALGGATTAPEAVVASIKAALGPDGQSFPWQSYCRAFAGE
jgi:hypothetical protein